MSRYYLTKDQMKTNLKRKGGNEYVSRLGIVQGENKFSYEKMLWMLASIAGLDNNNINESIRTT
jgi:hypothetical protein